jgi:hypothetical protein
LNTSLWYASPKGLCKIIAEYFEGENTTVNILSIDAILRKPSFEALVKIAVERTVQRWWFHKLGYIYGRNKR